MGNSLWRYLKTCHVNAPTLLLISIIKAISPYSIIEPNIPNIGCLFRIATVSNVAL